MTTYFNCDYMAGAHPDVLKSLCDTNLVKSVGYGFDSYTTQAREVILKACRLEDGAVFFLQGGTQANKIVIDRLKENVGFELWGPRGEKESIVRFVTDWSTTIEDVKAMLNLI